MKIIKGTTRRVLIFDDFVIKLSRPLYWFNRSRKQSFNWAIIKKRDFIFRIKEFRHFFSVWFNASMANWSEFVFYKKTHHTFCAKTYFSFFGLFNIQERVMHLNGNNYEDQYRFSRHDEYDNILKNTLLDRYNDLESHTFLNPINFGFSKKRKVFVCLDYEESIVRENILEFGKELQEAFKDFDKK